MVDIDVSKGTYTLNGKEYKIKGFTEEGGKQIEEKAKGKSDVSVYGGGGTTKSINTTDGGGLSKKDVIKQFGDIYGDVSKKGGYNTPMDFSNYTKQALGSLSVYGKDAENYESKNPGSLSKRNDIIAGNLYSDYNGSVNEQNIWDYMNKQNGFSNASEEDQKNTIRAIKARLGDAYKDEGGYLNEEGGEDRPGYYYENGNYYKILGYDELSEDDKKYADQMSNADRKRLSNEWAADMQGKTKTYLDYQREIEQREEIQGKKKDLYDIQREASVIQAEQTLRQSKEQVDNLIQNWEYLGNMGMPGLSKTKLSAVSDSIKEAETTLGEIKRLQQLSLDAQEKQWDIDVTQYTQQIDNLVYDLNWKVSSEIQNALNKYTTAELEGKLDTIDGVTAFKRSLLEDLDNNISGITEGSLAQMRYITDTYMEMADKAYEEAKTYKENQNKVNQDMSAIKGYYVDNNGNAILDSNGLPIKVPESAPIQPVFDKESGKLITFSYDDNGNIIANVQQVYEGDQSNLQSSIISALEYGASTQDILKYIPGATQDMVESLSKVVNQVYRDDGLPINYGGVNYNVVEEDRVNNTIAAYLKHYKGDGTEDGGWCGTFVNQYLKDMGVGKIYGDYLEGHGSSDKKANMNSKEPKVGSIVVMDSKKCPENGHVAIVTAVNGNSIEVLESNWQGDKKVHKNTYSLDSDKIYGYLDPTKSIDDYNNEGAIYSNKVSDNGGYDSNAVPDFTNYLKNGRKGFTDKARADIASEFGSWNEFTRQANAYKAEVDSQVGDVAKMMMNDLYDVYMWLTDDNKSSASFAKMNQLRYGAPGKGYEMKSKIDNLLSNQSLQKLITLKGDGATFGALSDKELGFITEAADWLSYNWRINKDTFAGELRSKINEMAKYYGLSLEDIKKMKVTDGVLSNVGGDEKGDPYDVR